MSDFCGEKRIKFKKPFFFSSVFFRLKHKSPRQRKRDIIYLSSEEENSEKESESAKRGVRFVAFAFFFPSSFLLVNEEAIKRAHDARVYIYDWVPPPPNSPPPPLCPS